MIAVIADDLTGAAEIAGLGWRHGLRSQILFRDEPPSAVDLVVYDSDSRLCQPREAARRVAGIAAMIRGRRPDWIYKKVDSVLRGNILAEVLAIQKVIGVGRTLLAPANPAAGRTIADGKYFIHGTPIHRTDFRKDPTHPRRSARVTDLLSPAGRTTLTLLRPEESFRPAGVVVGQAAATADVRLWAQRVDAETLPAGGADFFAALLRQNGLGIEPSRSRPPKTLPGRTLFVSGSLAESSTIFLNRCGAQGWPVLMMPQTWFTGRRPARRDEESWASLIADAMRGHRRVAVGIGPPALRGPNAALRLGQALAATIRRVLGLVQPARVCVEGGATAALLLQALGWKRLTVEREFATGVVGVHPVDRRRPLLVLKPGSYAWPDCLCAGVGGAGAGQSKLAAYPTARTIR